MAPTVIPPGDARAIKLFSVALFAETQRKHSFKNNLTGAAPKQPASERKLRSETDPGMPFVRIRDLSQGMGDKVSIDLVNILNVRPTMGDRKLTGRLGSLSFASKDITINQCRFGADTGGRMTQHRTLWNLRNLARANLVGLNARFEDQITLVHLAGSRGYQNDTDWVVPLASDSEFSEIMVNPVLPPTYSRRLIAGGGDTITDIGTSDYLALSDIDRIRAIIDDMPFPLQPVVLPGDVAAAENPLYVLFVTSRQWHYLQTATGGNDWRTFLQNAWNRARTFKGGGSHPLFTGEPGMWNGIVVKKINRAIRFAQGDICDEEDSTGSVQNTAASQPSDRAILVGAQALAWAYGKSGTSGTHYMWKESLEDHDNVLEVSTSAISGCSKLRFTEPASDGTIHDHGVMVLDSYAPAIT